MNASPESGAKLRFKPHLQTSPTACIHKWAVKLAQITDFRACLHLFKLRERLWWASKRCHPHCPWKYTLSWRGLPIDTNLRTTIDLPGWSWDAPPPALEMAMRLVLEGVQRLHELIEPLKREHLAAQLPHITLQTELQDILARGGHWLKVPIFTRAVDTLLPIVKTIQTPLAFSSGDYNPGNFLFEGEKLTGFIDFPGACFEDPHIGMAKYWTYSWYPLDKAGIVERYLEQVHLSFTEFAPSGYTLSLDPVM